MNTTIADGKDNDHSTTTNNTTIVVPPIIVAPDCHKDITARQIDSGFWMETTTTTYVDSCSQQKTITVSHALTGFSMLVIVILSTAAIIALLAPKGRHHKM